MATFNEFAKSYTEKLIEARDKQQAVAEILIELDRLQYASNDRRLSQEDKVKIVEIMRENLRNRVMLKGGDNQAYLAMITLMLQQIQGGK